LPYQAQGFQLPDFYSGATDQLGCLTEGFLLRRLYPAQAKVLFVPKPHKRAPRLSSVGTAAGCLTIAIHLI
jgi:hypothetical protein